MAKTKKSQNDFKNSSTDAKQTLLLRAEGQLKKQPPAQSVKTPEETSRLLHELEVHQIELQMQNEELRRAQDKLEVSRARYFDLYDLAPVGYLSLNEQGLILEANLTAAQMLGVERGRLTSQPVSRFIFRDDQDIYYLSRKQLFERQTPLTFELRLAGDDGRPFWVQMKTKLAQDNDGGLVWRATLSDITERKQIEEALFKSEEKYRTLFTHMTEAFALGEVIVAEDGTPCDYYFLEVNDAFERQSGLTREIIGRPITEVLPNLEKFWIDTYGAVAQTGEPVMFKNYNRDTDRHYEVFAYSPAKGRFAILFRDITKREEIEQALFESEQHYRIMFETMVPGVVYQDAEGKILSMNPAAERILGKTPAGFLGRSSIDEEYHTIREDGSPFPGLEHPSMIALRTGQESRGTVMGVYNPQEGNYRWIDISAVPLFRPEESKPYQVYAIFDDITERKRVEGIVQARLRMLTAANKITMPVDEFLQVALDEIEAQTGSTIGFYHFMEVDQETLSLQNWSTNTLRNLCTAEGKGSHYPVSQAGVWVECVHERRPVIHNDFSSLPHRKGLPQGHAPVTREMVVPIMRDGRIVAIIGVGNKPSDYDQTDINISSLLGDFSWEIVERIRAEQALRERTSELQQLSDTLEFQVRERTAKLAKANDETRRMSGKLLSAQEEERKRIAGEIHDTLGSHLSAIKYKAEDAIHKIGMTPTVAAELLEPFLPLIQEGIEECRRIQADLRPPMLDDLGLLPTLSWFFRRFQSIYSTIQIEQEIGIEEGDAPIPLKIVVFRVTQEALNNIAKYSRADLVQMSLRKLDDRMELLIRDNGQGFNLEEVRSPGRARKGLGITSMKERVELSGGLFAIESSEGKGTIISAEWPIGQ